MEIALEFLLNASVNARDWLSLLAKIKTVLNNAIAATTGQTPNKLANRFTPRRLLDLLGDLATSSHLEAQ